MLALLLDDHLKEEACMKYINAKNLLPDALVKELQSYIQGGYLYVPADQAQQKRWGEASGYRQDLQQRNRRIVEEFRNGISMEELAEKYFLSVYAIRKIIYQKWTGRGCRNAAPAFVLYTDWFGIVLWIEKRPWQ